MYATTPMSGFQVPRGKIAVTSDVAGQNGYTAVLPASDLDKLMSECERCMELSQVDRIRLESHLQVRVVVRELLRSPDADSLKAATFAALWLALNHPVDPGAIRAAVSAQLRQLERSHITVSIDSRNRWGFAVSDRIADMAEYLDAMPDDLACGISIRSGDLDRPTGQA